MSRTLCRVFGAAFVLVGLAGFADASLFGLHLTTVHNLIHVFSGLVFLYVGLSGSADAVRGLMLTFGSVYVLIGLLGFLAPSLVQALIGHGGAPLDAAALAPDNILHVLVGTLLVFTALAHSTGEVPPDRAVERVMTLDLSGVPAPEPRPLPSPVRPPVPHPDPAPSPAPRPPDPRPPEHEPDPRPPPMGRSLRDLEWLWSRVGLVGALGLRGGYEAGSMT